MRRQVFYPRVVTKLQGRWGNAAEAVKAIEALERQHLSWMCKSLHRHHSFPRDLLRTDFRAGGIGLESWVSKTGRARVEVARRLEAHQSHGIMKLWWHLQWADWGVKSSRAVG